MFDRGRLASALGKFIKLLKLDNCPLCLHKGQFSIFRISDILLAYDSWKYELHSFIVNTLSRFASAGQYVHPIEYKGKTCPWRKKNCHETGPFYFHCLRKIGNFHLIGGDSVMVWIEFEYHDKTGNEINFQLNEEYQMHGCDRTSRIHGLYPTLLN